jgi:hypothetical protein
MNNYSCNRIISKLYIKKSLFQSIKPMTLVEFLYLKGYFFGHFMAYQTIKKVNILSTKARNT